MKAIEPGDIVGDYRVIGLAGCGGMGAVYRIEHVITRRIEAMKLLPPGLSGDPEQVRRFEREIQVQARLHHPNIVTLYNAVRQGDAIALVMEFVDGESLQHRLQAGRLAVETAVNLAGQVLEALAYAHAAGVIHRDVAPSNIIVTPEGTAKLTDFGLARGKVDLRVSTAGVPLGSPWYMSPEQVKGEEELDARTDLYALGAVLHEMLTGGKLYEAEGVFDVMRAQVETVPAAPSSRNPLVPATLDRVVRKALAKAPAQRFATAEEFRRALREALNGTLPAAAPPSRQNWSAPVQQWKLGVQVPRSPRAAVLMTLAPTAMVACLYSFRTLPEPVRAAEPMPRAVAQQQYTLPAFLPMAAPPPLSMAVTNLPAPETPPGAEPEAVAPVPAETPKRAAPGISRRVPARLPEIQVAKAERLSAIRVTGGEMHPAGAVAGSGVTLPRPVETAGALALKAEPEEAAPAEEEALTEAAAPGPEAVPEAVPRTGNRLVRALGKVNPFRKRGK
jgi:eukaryotic-like serine/threonine-protein kinase